MDTKNGIAPEKEELLRQFGFQGSESDYMRRMCQYFSGFQMVLDPKMLVTGDHATDYSAIIYAEEDGFCGLYYAPSILEYMLLDYGKEWDFKRFLRELNRFSDCEITLRSQSGYPSFCVEITEQAFADKDIEYEVSTMLKLVGQLDYLLMRTRERLRAKRRKQMGR